MNLAAVKQLAELLERSGLAALSYEDGEFKLALSKPMNPALQTASPTVAEPHTEPPAESRNAAPDAPENLVTITAPVVGTAYRAAEPGKAPLVSPGDTVRKGDALCIIEAMKIFNEITAPQDGRVVEIAFTDGELAEFGAKLIVLDVSL
ncbi:MAG: hypothetical protein LBC38_04570 [Oscillospiraceae bacterium]|jgi:acetyl-CoA carboxylase biotin carboxyl carrier protein|nr:hypothetical protein [Oscillospiraceae bacterium]